MGVKVVKASLVNLLLEEGEENAAVMLAQSALPEFIDTDDDAGRLSEFGLAEDDVADLLDSAAHSGAVTAASEAEIRELEATISRRWADLVTRWAIP
jgi:hypothetical protein